MNEESIRALLDRLFNLEYRSDYGNYDLPVIATSNKTMVETTVRQWALDFRDRKVGEMEAKVFVYENIIRNSNFAPMIYNGNTTGGGNTVFSGGNPTFGVSTLCEYATESGLLEE